MTRSRTSKAGRGMAWRWRPSSTAIPAVPRPRTRRCLEPVGGAAPADQRSVRRHEGRDHPDRRADHDRRSDARPAFRRTVQVTEVSLAATTSTHRRRARALRAAQSALSPEHGRTADARPDRTLSGHCAAMPAALLTVTGPLNRARGGLQPHRGPIGLGYERRVRPKIAARLPWRR